MKKVGATTKRTTLAKSQPDGLAPLIAEVRGLVQSARHAAATAVNTLQVLTNFEIGRRIVEHEQKGQGRAKYGAEMLKDLSSRLTEEFGRGFSLTNLKLMRQFYVENQHRIGQEATDQLSGARIRQQPAGRSRISQQPTGHSTPPTIPPTPTEGSAKPFTLSWTHYVLLLTIEDPAERSFYEIEATSEGWSVPELKRQKASCLYERLALSRDKAGVKRLAEKGQIIVRPQDVLKEPLVLEFLGLDEQASYSETELEWA